MSTAIATRSIDQAVKRIHTANAKFGRHFVAWVSLVGSELRNMQAEYSKDGPDSQFTKRCTAEFGWSRSQVHRLMDAQQTISSLSPMGDRLPLPANERQCRELTCISEDELPHIWQQICEAADEQQQPLTAGFIREQISSLQPPAIEAEFVAEKVDYSELLPLNEIIHGDCAGVLREFPAECIDLIITSPPYDELREYGGHDWDFEAIAQELARILQPGGVLVWIVADQTVNGRETGSSYRQALFLGELLLLHDTMIYRANKPPKTRVRYTDCFEFMFVFAKGAPKTFNPLLVD